MNPDPASLDRLRDVIAPPPAPWWPPAPGWLWLLGALLVLSIAAAGCAFLWRQRNAYRREALAELRRQEKSLADPRQRVEALANLAELVKRAALSVFPRRRVARLTGPAWFAFLDRTGGTTGFATGAGALLEKAVCDPGAVAGVEQEQVSNAAALVRHWIRRHDAGGAEGGGP